MSRPTKTPASELTASLIIKALGKSKRVKKKKVFGGPKDGRPTAGTKFSGTTTGPAGKTKNFRKPFEKGDNNLAKGLWHDGISGNAPRQMRAKLTKKKKKPVFGGPKDGRKPPNNGGRVLY